MRFLRWLVWRGKLLVGYACGFVGVFAFVLVAPSALIASHGETYDRRCGGVHGMSAQTGRALLIGTACAVGGPLLVAAGAALLGRRRGALIGVGLAAVALLGLGLSGVSGPHRLGTAGHAVLHPPPYEPGTVPDRMGVCPPRQSS